MPFLQWQQSTARKLSRVFGFGIRTRRISTIGAEIVVMTVMLVIVITVMKHVSLNNEKKKNSQRILLTLLRITRTIIVAVVAMIVIAITIVIPLMEEILQHLRSQKSHMCFRQAQRDSSCGGAHNHNNDSDTGFHNKNFKKVMKKSGRSVTTVMLVGIAIVIMGNNGSNSGHAHGMSRRSNKVMAIVISQNHIPNS